jgi:hypothetical protein
MQAKLSERDIERIHWMTLALRLPEGGVGAEFPNNDSCLNRLAAVRWPAGVTCPRCHERNIAPKSSRKTYRCRKCKYQFSATVGTFAHGGNKNLLTYFLAAEDIVVRKATMVGFASITGHDFKDRHRLAYETSRRLLKLLTDELLLDGGGLLSHCICQNDIELPLDIEIGSYDHLSWLSRTLRS